jgi:hypothetical protein
MAFTLAGVLWLTNPTRLRWCAIFPEDQHHIHETQYDRVEIVHNRDLSFYTDGEITAYVTTYQECTLPVDEVREELENWCALLSKHDNATYFAEFLRNA